MKTSILKFSILYLMSIVLYGCKDCKRCEDILNKEKINLEASKDTINTLSTSINKIFEYENLDYSNQFKKNSMCDFADDYAFHPKDSWYITKAGKVEGKAFLKIPIPSGHNITDSIYKERDTVKFIVSGDIYTKSFQYSGQYLSGLSTKPGREIYVFVEYNYKSDECDPNSTLRKKYKGSLLGGQPFLD